MKLALVIALAPDRRSGRVLSGLMPADQAISQVKQAINANDCPDARFPVLQAVAADSRLREHRFSPSLSEIAAAAEVNEVNEINHVRDSFIAVEIGEGDDKILINVATGPEAEAVRGLAVGLKQAAEDSAKAETDSIEVMKECDRLRKLAEGMDTANQRLAAYETDLKSRSERIAELEADLNSRSERIAELEADLKSRSERIKELEAQLEQASKKHKK